MTNIQSLEGLIATVLIVIITCVHIKRITILKSYLNLREFGPLSIFNKAAVIGLRLQLQIGIICIALALYILIR